MERRLADWRGVNPARLAACFTAFYGSGASRGPCVSRAAIDPEAAAALSAALVSELDEFVREEIGAAPSP